jgi:hypothetical protein
MLERENRYLNAAQVLVCHSSCARQVIDVGATWFQWVREINTSDDSPSVTHRQDHRQISSRRCLVCLHMGLGLLILAQASAQAYLSTQRVAGRTAPCNIGVKMVLVSVVSVTQKVIVGIVA